MSHQGEAAAAAAASPGQCRLPNDILLLIFPLCDHHTVQQLRLCSRRFTSLASPYLIRQLSLWRDGLDFDRFKVLAGNDQILRGVREFTWYDHQLLASFEDFDVYKFASQMVFDGDVPSESTHKEFLVRLRQQQDLVKTDLDITALAEALPKMTALRRVAIRDEGLEAGIYQTDNDTNIDDEGHQVYFRHEFDRGRRHPRVPFSRGSRASLRHLSWHINDPQDYVPREDQTRLAFLYSQALPGTKSIGREFSRAFTGVTTAFARLSADTLAKFRLELGVLSGVPVHGFKDWSLCERQFVPLFSRLTTLHLAIKFPQTGRYFPLENFNRLMSPPVNTMLTDLNLDASSAAFFTPGPQPFNGTHLLLSQVEPITHLPHLTHIAIQADRYDAPGLLAFLQAHAPTLQHVTLYDDGLYRDDKCNLGGQPDSREWSRVLRLVREAGLTYRKFVIQNTADEQGRYRVPVGSGQTQREVRAGHREPGEEREREWAKEVARDPREDLQAEFERHVDEYLAGRRDDVPRFRRCYGVHDLDD